MCPVLLGYFENLCFKFTSTKSPEAVSAKLIYKHLTNGIRGLWYLVSPCSPLHNSPVLFDPSPCLIHARRDRIPHVMGEGGQIACSSPKDFALFSVVIKITGYC